MITEALRYPRESDDVVMVLFLGGILGFFGFLLFPLIFVFGYLLNVLRRTMAGDDTLPAFENWEGLFMDGLKVFVVTFVYGLVPSIFGGGIVLVGSIGVATDPNSPVGVLFILLGALLWIVLGLAMAYLIPAALANVAKKDTYGAGFDFSLIWSAVTTGTYLTGWLYAFAILVGASIVVSVLNVIPGLGVLIGPFVMFYASISAYYVIGHTWAELTPVGVDRGDTSGEQATI